MGNIRDKALDDYDDGKRLKSSAKEWLDSGSENIYEAEDIIKAQQATIDKLVEALNEWQLVSPWDRADRVITLQDEQKDLINSVTEKK